MIAFPPEGSENARGVHAQSGHVQATHVDGIAYERSVESGPHDSATPGSDDLAGVAAHRPLSGAATFPDHFESFRPLRGDGLRSVLDEEFQKSYRFEGLSNVFHDIKELFRKVVTRDDEEDLPGVGPQ